MHGTNMKIVASCWLLTWLF